MSQEPSLPWSSFPEGEVVPYGENIWFVRIGVVVNRPKKKKLYEDPWVSLNSLSTEGNNILAYSLQAKREFPDTFEQPAYLSLFSTRNPNKNPKIVYKDQKVYLYRFNGTKQPNYWFLARNREKNA